MRLAQGGPADHHQVREAVGDLARNLGKDEDEVVRHLRQRLGVLIVRDNAAMMASRHPTFAPQKLTATQTNLYNL